MKEVKIGADDDFWETWENIMFTEKRRRAIPAAVDNIISLLNLNPELKILDLCCGIGRHSLELSRRGYSVVGVDRTKQYIDRAKEDAAREDLLTEFVCQDMLSFRRNDSFDVVINMSSSVGFFENHDDPSKVLENIFRSLKPKGRVFFDMAGKELIVRDFSPRTWKSGDFGYALYEDHPIDEWRKMKHRWTHIAKDGTTKTWEFTGFIYSAEELRTMLIQTGFHDIQVFGSLEGIPYDHNAKRLIVIGSK